MKNGIRKIRPVAKGIQNSVKPWSRMSQRPTSFTTPLATILLALIAVPLSRSAPRESRFRNFALALVVYVALFSMTSVLRTWIEQDKLGALPGLWSAYIIETLLLILLVTQPRLKRR